MDALKYKRFYKSNSMRRVEEMKAVTKGQTKKQREASRHEMRQSNRYISDSDEENDAHAGLHLYQEKHFRVEGANKIIMQPTEEYHSRLHRLREFRERKQMLQQKQASQRPPFIPYVSSARNYEEVTGVRKHARHLRELQLKPQGTTSETKNESPLATFKVVKPRVDCWLRREPNTIAELAERVSPYMVKVSAKKSKTGQIVSDRCAQPAVAAVKPTKIIKELKQPFLKPTKNFLTVNHPAKSQTALITSTARKNKKPETLNFNASSGAVVAATKKTLTVAEVESLFDGISPIDREPFPSEGPIVLSENANKGDSIWEPQPVADILETTGIVCGTGEVLVADSPVTDAGNKGSTFKPTLNESFTIGYALDPVDGYDEDSIFGCRPMITSKPVPTVSDVNQPHTTVFGLDSHKPGGSIAECSKQSPPGLPDIILPSARRRSSLWSVTLVSGVDAPSPSLENADPTKTCVTDDSELSSKSASLRKRSWRAFTEETKHSVISPSVSNFVPDEKNAVAECIPKRRSSSPSSSPVTIGENDTETESAAAPEEVLKMTNFYYEKVDSELARLHALCNEYAPFVEKDVELNDHCRGLIIAAQGQTNILINKKLTKFRDLIGHYKNKWNDRKVRNDDLDGFWLMLSLDLENLDKRFAELRTLRENNWQESEPEPPPKVKKLQTGGGIKKRTKKTAAGVKPSSSIAELIRKARQEQLKQKAANIDLGTLAETVTLVKSPTKKAVRIADTPKRSSARKRLSVCTGWTPTAIHWDRPESPAPRKRQTIFSEITQPLDTVKSILKTPSVADKRRPKSVLFLDSGLDTPQTRRRQSCRKVVDTPKPKIKFNEELEVEHIDNLVSRTPSRLDEELRKRRHQSLMLSGALNQHEESIEKRGQRNVYARGTPKRTNSVGRGNRRSSRNRSVRWDTEDDDYPEAAESQGSGGKRVTRSSACKSRKKILDFS